MIVLHELPLSIVEYDGFKEFVYSLNPLFKIVSRTTIKLDCMRTFEDAKLGLREVFKNSISKVSLTANYAAYPIIARMACDVPNHCTHGM